MMPRSHKSEASHQSYLRRKAKDPELWARKNREAYLRRRSRLGLDAIHAENRRNRLRQLRWCTYQLVSRDGVVLYVGKTNDIVKRSNQHLHGPFGSDIARIRRRYRMDEIDALVLESLWIRKYRPPKNVLGMGLASGPTLSHNGLRREPLRLVS